MIFGIFNELLSTQNVNVARFARNVALNETFYVIFKHYVCNSFTGSLFNVFFPLMLSIDLSVKAIVEKVQRRPF